ncbi:MAG: hypothetical protein NTU57_05160 [Candidatus Aenigmarchaeota archaeon]|nr:hypothetical protein [Candidatus Aenigmarchaeota archaeon]
MNRFKVILSIVILIVSVLLLFSKLFSSQPITIILETGQEVNTLTSDYFSLTDALLLIASSFLIGSVTIYLFYNSDTKEVIKSFRKENGMKERYGMVIPLLRKEERAVFQELVDSNGEMLQNALVLKSGMSKVKMTRVLSSLERKGLILKERHGLTNRIKLKPA